MFTKINILSLGFYKKFKYYTLNQFTFVMPQAKKREILFISVDKLNGII